MAWKYINGVWVKSEDSSYTTEKNSVNSATVEDSDVESSHSNDLNKSEDSSYTENLSAPVNENSDDESSQSNVQDKVPCKDDSMNLRETIPLKGFFTGEEKDDYPYLFLLHYYLRIMKEKYKPEYEDATKYITESSFCNLAEIDNLSEIPMKEINENVLRNNGFNSKSIIRFMCNICPVERLKTLLLLLSYKLKSSYIAIKFILFIRFSEILDKEYTIDDLIYRLMIAMIRDEYGDTSVFFVEQQDTEVWDQSSIGYDELSEFISKQPYKNTKIQVLEFLRIMKEIDEILSDEK